MLLFIFAVLLCLMNDKQQLRYCLYARKSSESDERQAMSIDSQLNEMRALAENEGLNIVCELQESHSAKESGQRPVYNCYLKAYERTNIMPFLLGLPIAYLVMLVIWAQSWI